MIRKIAEFYSFLFEEEESITVAYFSTKSETKYRAYFYPIPDYFDKLSPETLLYQFGYHFGFTKLAPNEERKEPIDFRVRNTIIAIINKFFEEKGIDKILIFYCDDGDGKNTKRSISFDNWYEVAETKTCYKKYDEQIIVVDESGNKTSTDYISLIIECENPHVDSILMEFQSLKESLIAAK